MTSANGVNYTWDNNGNLLNDGDRLSQTRWVEPVETVNPSTGSGQAPVTTNYTLDLNAGLTQVLNDGTNTYLYG